MPWSLKTKLYTAIYPPSAMVFGVESWTLRKNEERILEATELEMRVLKRIRGVTLKDREKSA